MKLNMFVSVFLLSYCIQEISGQFVYNCYGLLFLINARIKLTVKKKECQITCLLLIALSMGCAATILAFLPNENFCSFNNLGWFSVAICKYKPGYKSHDLL